MSVAGSIILMLLMLSVLTVVHEWGHYIAARIFKVKVNEFSIFMGPKIYQKKTKTGMLFTIRCLPIGGYCALEGEEEDEQSEDSFSGKPWWQRAIILIAGVFMNFILALLIVTVLFCFSGYDTRKVSTVSEDMPMAMVNLEVGDKVTEYNDMGITTPTDYTLYTYVKETVNVSFTVVRKNGKKETYIFERTFDRNENKDDEENPGTLLTTVEIFRKDGKKKVPVGTYTSFWDNNRALTITMDYADGTQKVYSYDSSDPEEAEYIEIYNVYSMFRKFGFSFTYSEKGNIFECIGNAFLYCISLVKSVFLSLWWLISGQLGMDAMAGPIGITSLVNDVVTAEAAVSLKAMTLFEMMALISANLAVFNLLPIPGLDGGKLLFIVIELLRGGKKISAEKEGIISIIFFVLIILLAVVIAGNDIVNLVRK